MSNKLFRTNRKLKIRPLAFNEKYTTLCKVIANSLNIITLIVRNLVLTMLLLAITLLNSSSALIRKDFKLGVVVIDAGHGGHDTGTLGKKSKEKDIALKIALKVGSYIEKN